jgi:hypothetical protein
MSEEVPDAGAGGRPIDTADHAAAGAAAPEGIDPHPDPDPVEVTDPADPSYVEAYLDAVPAERDPVDERPAP